MRLGLFLDVDGVLTAEAVNLQLARLLEVETEFVVIENAFAKAEIDNDEFNERFIPLFRQAGFSRDFVEEHFSDIRLRIGYERLLDRPEPVFLISSGPSYFVDALVDRFKIPQERVICSRYEFEEREPGLITRCVDPITSAAKGDFVEAWKGSFDLTVGVGDSPEHDSSFLSHCTVRILMGEFRSGYVGVREIAPLVSLVNALSTADVGRHPRTLLPGTRPRVFIGSSSEGLEASGALQMNLERQVEVVPWQHGAFQLSRSHIDNLGRILEDVDFAILVITPDDVTTKRGEQLASPRDNVIFELGLFMGRLGFERTFIVHPKDPVLHFPSDLEGVTKATYDSSKTRLETALSTTSFRLLEAMGLR